MSIEIPIPKISDVDATVTIQEWYVTEGDAVKKGDILFDVETEKAILEVESRHDGIVKEILLEVGSKAKPNDPALILQE
jgi:pyruvate dehydrogenase E2 component (dihydrolipoamide acetyltransferase)